MNILNRFAFLAVFAAVLLSGCPFSSSVPIGSPDVKVPQKMMGKWIDKSVNESTEEAPPTYYVLSNIDGYKFKIEENNFSSTDKKYSKTNYTAYISMIGDDEFLNIIQGNSELYYFYKIEWKENSFILHEVTNNIKEKFSSSADLKAFIEKYKNLSFFYNSDAVSYVRMK